MVIFHASATFVSCAGLWALLDMLKAWSLVDTLTCPTFPRIILCRHSEFDSSLMCCSGERTAGTSNLQLSLRLSGNDTSLSASTGAWSGDSAQHASRQSSSTTLLQASVSSEDGSEADSASEETTLAAARQGDPSISGIDVQVGHSNYFCLCLYFAVL